MVFCYNSLSGLSWFLILEVVAEMLYDYAILMTCCCRYKNEKIGIQGPPKGVPSKLSWFWIEWVESFTD